MTFLGIKQLRNANNLTQAQFADRIGKHKQVISDWERGRQNISEANKALIEEAFNVRFVEHIEPI